MFIKFYPANFSRKNIPAPGGTRIFFFWGKLFWRNKTHFLKNNENFSSCFSYDELAKFRQNIRCFCRLREITSRFSLIDVCFKDFLTSFITAATSCLCFFQTYLFPEDINVLNYENAEVYRLLSWKSLPNMRISMNDGVKPSPDYDLQEYH